jgi:hypothetical protein
VTNSKPLQLLEANVLFISVSIDLNNVRLRPEAPLKLESPNAPMLPTESQELYKEEGTTMGLMDLEPVGKQLKQEPITEDEQFPQTSPPPTATTSTAEGASGGQMPEKKTKKSVDILACYICHSQTSFLQIQCSTLSEILSSPETEKFQDTDAQMCLPGMAAPWYVSFLTLILYIICLFSSVSTYRNF